MMIICLIATIFSLFDRLLLPKLSLRIRAKVVRNRQLMCTPCKSLQQAIQATKPTRKREGLRFGFATDHGKFCRLLRRSWRRIWYTERHHVHPRTAGEVKFIRSGIARPRKVNLAVAPRFQGESHVDRGSPNLYVVPVGYGNAEVIGRVDVERLMRSKLLGSAEFGLALGIETDPKST